MKWLKPPIAVPNSFVLLGYLWSLAFSSWFQGDDAFALGARTAASTEITDAYENPPSDTWGDSNGSLVLSASSEVQTNQDAKNGKASDLLGADGKPLAKSRDSETQVDCDKIKRQMTAVMNSKSLLMKFCESQNIKMKELGLRYCPQDSCFVSLATPARDPITIFFNAWSSDYRGSTGLMVGVEFSLDRNLEGGLSCMRIGKETFTLDEIEEYQSYVRYLESKLECEQL